MAKKLNEAEAWRLIAKKIEDGADMPMGLCWMLSDLLMDGVISLDTDIRMTNRVSGYLNNSNVYAFPQGKYRGARLLAALWMAEDAEHRVRVIRIRY